MGLPMRRLKMNHLNGRTIKTGKRIVALATINFLVAIQLVGCAGVGPATINRDRFDYVSAISESWKRQTLLNLLKTRYLDAPVYMDVASVINQYALESEIELGFAWNGGQTQSIGGRGMYTDRPTITYSPLMGEKFARSLLKPLPLAPILLLIQSQYPADKILRICIQSINGIDNIRYGSAAGRNEDPEFDELVELFQRIYNVDGIAMRSQKTDAGANLTIIFRQPVSAAAEEDLRRLKELLALDPQVNQFNMVNGKFAMHNREIAILSRSMYQIMTAFAAYIEAPPSDSAGTHMDEALHYSGMEKNPRRPWIKVLNGTSEPDSAFVSVHYRNHWFWIDDQDIYSKYMFNFLMVLFSFTERGKSVTEAPVITVPTN
jgi:hypothetical protein